MISRELVVDLAHAAPEFPDVYVRVYSIALECALFGRLIITPSAHVGPPFSVFRAAIGVSQCAARTPSNAGIALKRLGLIGKARSRDRRPTMVSLVAPSLCPVPAAVNLYSSGNHGATQTWIFKGNNPELA